jgi:hypothetical protein
MLVLSPLTGMGEEMRTVWPSVLEITYASSPQDSEIYEKVIADAVTLELERANLRILRLEDLTEEEVAIREWKGLLDRREASPLLEEAGVGFVLISRYTTNQSRIRVEFSWYDVERAELATEVSRSARIDLSLDAVIKEAVREILSQNGDRIRSLAKEVPVEAIAEKEETEQEPSKEEEAAETNEEQIVEVTEPERERERRDVKHLEVSAGFSPFITTGAVSEYFKMGLMPSLYASYRFALANGLLGIGLYAGFNSFQAVGLLTTSQSYLLPAGLDVRYWFGDGEAIGLFIHIDGGPALFSVDVEGLGQFTKLIFFVLGGIGFDVPFSDSFGANFGASYSVFFDQPDPIMGFTPSVSLFIRI